MLLILARAIQRRRVLHWEVIAVALTVSAATSIRFIGLTLLPVVAVGIFMANRSRGRAGATVTAVLTTALSSLGLVMVAARNVSLGVPALGVRQPSDVSVITVAKQTAVRLGEYVYPTTSPSPLITALVGIPIAILVLYGFIRSLADHSEIVSLLGLFKGIYWLSLWYSQFATQIDEIDARLTAPVLTPMLILIAYALLTIASKLPTRSRGRGPERRGKWVPAVIATASVFVLGALSMNAAESLLFVRHAATVGNGYNSKDSLSSPLALSLAKLPRGGIAANDPSLAYWVSGRTPISTIPGRDRYWSAEQTRSGIRDLKNGVNEGDVAYLAFFTSADTSLTPQELQRAGIQIRLLKTYSDGDLYEAL